MGARLGARKGWASPPLPLVGGTALFLAVAYAFLVWDGSIAGARLADTHPLALRQNALPHLVRSNPIPDLLRALEDAANAGDVPLSEGHVIAPRKSGPRLSAESWRNDQRTDDSGTKPEGGSLSYPPAAEPTSPPPPVPSAGPLAPTPVGPPAPHVPSPPPSPVVEGKEGEASATQRNDAARPAGATAEAGTAAGTRQQARESATEEQPVPASVVPPLGHPGDWEEVRKLREIIKGLVRPGDNTVVVTPANAGFLDLVFNLRCRLQALGAHHVLYWALDKPSADRFAAEGIPHYYDPGLFSISEVKGYHDPDYIRMMSERPRVWWRMLATGYDTLFLDADVVAFQHPDRYFERDADLEGQVNGWGWEFEKSKTRATNLCAGAFWIRSSDMSLRFMESSFASFEERRGKVKRWDDQLAMNWVLHNESVAAIITADVPEGQKKITDVRPGIMRVGFVDPEIILPGHLFWGTQMTGSGYNVTLSIKIRQNDTEPIVFSPSLFHMSGHGDKSQKVERMKQFGWWELDDSGNCRDAS